MHDAEQRLLQYRERKKEYGYIRKQHEATMLEKMAENAVDVESNEPN